MTVAELSELIVLLSEKGAEIKATPAAFLAALVRCVFAYKGLTDAQVAWLCNISTRTLTKNSDQIYDLLSAAWEFEEMFHYEDRDAVDGKDSGKDSGKVSSLVEKSSSGETFVKLGKGRFLNSKGEIVSNCNTSLYKKHLKKASVVSNCNNESNLDALRVNLSAQNAQEIAKESPFGQDLFHNPKNSPVELEREKREKFPPDPLIEREERKRGHHSLREVVPPNPPEGECEHAGDNACASHLVSEKPQGKRRSERAPQAAKPREQLQYQAHFDAFVKGYPSHGNHRETSKGYRVMLARWWRDCEDEGYTGDDIFEIYQTLSETSQWQADEGGRIPSAWRFLASYVYLFPPSGQPNERAAARLLKADAALIKFCELYPKRTNPASRAMIKAWKQCIKREGRSPEEICLCLELFMRSEDWGEEEGCFVPQADTWLRKGHYGQVLAYVRDLKLAPRGKVQDYDQAGVRDVAAFNRFCSLYPKKMPKSLTRAHYRVWEAWLGLEREGFAGELIMIALRRALESDSWTTEGGRYIPKPENFLAKGWIDRFVTWPEVSR